MQRHSLYMRDAGSPATLRDFYLGSGRRERLACPCPRCFPTSILAFGVDPALIRIGGSALRAACDFGAAEALPLFGVLVRRDGFKAAGVGMSGEAASAMSSPKRAATSPASSRPLASGTDFDSIESCAAPESNSLSSTPRRTNSNWGRSSSRAPAP